jgi:16S rRNA (guanine527-N7)-methyltransferase
LSGGLGALLSREAQRLGLALEPAAAARMAEHFSLVKRWERAVDLTSARDPARALPFYLEAIQVAQELASPEAGRLVDVGSGGGYPGLVLAILQPRWETILVERASRKAAFLEEASRRLGLERVRVLNLNLRRGADLPEAAAFDRLTAKAVGRFTLALDLLEERGLPGARGILLTGAGGSEQISAGVEARRGRLRLVEKRRLAGRERSYAVIVAVERGGQERP